MSGPSDQEKYSLDDMMERLKKRPAEDAIEDGELVTRTDGSQAIRVRKRKRRSHQPHKEELKQTRRARMVQVSAALILLLFALFAAGAAIVYANSAPFRKGLITKISSTSGASAELTQFRMNPASANATVLTLTWPEGNALASLKLRNVRAEISPSSFLGRAMTGDEISATQGSLNLRMPVAGQPLRSVPESEGPTPIHFNLYTIPKLQILGGDPAAPIIRLQDTEASLSPSGRTGRTQLLLNRGDLTLRGWPKLELDRAHIEFRGNEMDIIGMRLKHSDDTRGIFELAGTLAPYRPEQLSTLAIHLESYLLSGLVGSELGDLFSGASLGPGISGRIDTLSSVKSNYLSFTTGPNPESSLSITFRNTLASGFELSGFKFLSTLALIIDDPWFERPLFADDASGMLRRAKGTVALSDLDFVNKGRMALRGMLVMTPNKTLSGNLEIGLTEAMILSSKNRRLDATFGPPKEGFRWVTLMIGGSAASPTDDFQELFDAAEVARPAISGEGIPSFEDLTQPE